MKYDFTLFIAGKKSVHCQKSIAIVTRCLKKRLKDDFVLSIVDAVESPLLTLKQGVFVTPSWVRNHPTPRKKLIGNFNTEENVLKGLDILTK